jgi:NADPH-dependent curcumin reductase CurA
LSDQYKIVSRLGGNGMEDRIKAFEVLPLTTLSVGVDAIPDFVKVLFDGNDLGKLGNI